MSPPDPSPGGSSESAKLPLAPDMNQILNRISLGLAKHERVLQTLRRPSPPKPSRSSAGFSSLATGPSNATTDPGGIAAPGGSSRLLPPTRPSLAPAPNNDDDGNDAEFRADRSLPPNAGIGWQPPSTGEGGAGSGAGKGRGDNALRARLLGRGAAEKRGGGGGPVENGKNKRGRAEESESEQEEGRSALGRGKKRNRTGTGTGTERGPGDGDGRAVVDAQSLVTGNAKPLGEAVSRVDKDLGNEEKNKLEAPQTPGPRDPSIGTDDVTEKRRKKNKKKKKRKAGREES